MEPRVCHWRSTKSGLGAEIGQGNGGCRAGKDRGRKRHAPATGCRLGFSGVPAERNLQGLVRAQTIDQTRHDTGLTEAIDRIKRALLIDSIEHMQDRHQQGVGINPVAVGLLIVDIANPGMPWAGHKPGQLCNARPRRVLAEGAIKVHDVVFRF